MTNPNPTYEELLKENEALKKALKSKERSTNDSITDSKTFLRLLFQSSLLPIIVMDVINYHFIDCNEAAVKIYGYKDKSELIGKTPFDVSAPFQYDHSPSEEKAQYYINKALEEGSATFDWKHQKPNGEIWDAEVHLLTFKHCDSTFLQFSLVDITEREKHKRELQRSQANMSAILENSLDSIWSVDLDYKLIYTNKVFKNHIKKHYNQTISVGSNIIDILPSPFNTLWKKRLKKIFKNEIINFTDEVPINNTLLYTEVIMSPIRVDDKVIGASIHSKDISEQKKTEEELIETNAMKEMIMDNIPSFIFWKNRQSEYMGCNRKFAEVAGVGYQFNIIGKTDYELAWKKEEAEFFREVDERIMKSGIGEYRIIESQQQANGKQAWLETNKIPLFNSEGEVIGILGTYEDITERKETEEALVASEQKFKETVDMLPQIVFESDINGNFTFANQQAFISFGYTKEELNAGINLLQCIAEECHEDVKINVPQIYNGHISSNEYIARRKDGSKFPVIIYSTPILKNNKAIGLRGIVIDITERKEIEKELIKAKEKAEESDHLKSAFLANMSHEIRTPMNGILGFAELLKTPNLSGEDQQNFINVIEKSGERMLNIINDLVNISKIEAGQIDVNIVETNINEQFQFLEDFFSAEAAHKNLTLIKECPLPTDEATLFTDKEKIYAIMTNLIKNAIKFTEKGSVTFGYKSELKGILFYVKDTGVGIPKEKQKAVFDRFVQVDPQSSNINEGAGLGLSISKGYSDLLNGKMSMQSIKGRGTTFTFFLPKSSYDDLHKEQLNIPASVIIEARKLSILVVEDDMTSLFYLNTILKNENYILIIAKSGTEAIRLFNENKDIDLVLTGIKMPDMDGMSIAKAIRKTNKKVPIFAHTSFSLVHEKDKTQNMFDEILTKPFQATLLKEKIKEYLQQ